MQTLTFTILALAFILLGVLLGIELQSKFSFLNKRIVALYNEVRLDLAVLNARLNKIDALLKEQDKRGKNGTKKDFKEIPEWEQPTDPDFKRNQ